MKITDRFRFRAWDIVEKTYIEDAQFTYDHGCEGGVGSFRHYSFKNLLEDKSCIVEQCTGLKDSVGNLIYEGDVLKITDQGIDDIVKVYWNNGMYCYEISTNSANLVFFDLSDSEIKVEVIGNIHQTIDKSAQS